MYGDGPWGVPGYTEVRELGSGAAGRVVLARRDYDGAEVAIKYLSDELRSDVGFVARFRHEARLLATLQSQYHARLIDYVEAGQGAAIVMELINGVSLRELLRSEGPTGPEAALTVLKGSLLGLASAHAIGVVHRDFKPENVMVRGDGTSKLVDFGIAVRVGDEAGAAGTPPYMAPEQWAGSPAGPATDVYAATVVFFECLTGMRPFRAPNMAALARQHQSAPPPVEEVPAPLQGLVERGLAKDPAERPPSAEAFLTELEAVATEAYGPDWEERGRRRLAALAGLLVLLFPSALEEPAETQTSLAETHFPEPTRLLSKLPAKIALGAVGVGVLVAAVVVILTSGSAEPVLQAGTSSVTPTTTEALTPEPEETVPEETPEESTEPTLDPTTPDPTPTDTATAAPPVVQPTATAKPTKTATPTPVKTPRKTRKPTPSRTPTSTPTPTPEPEMSGEVNDRTPTTRPTTPAPTPTPVPVTPTPPRTTATTPSEEPGGDDESPTVTPDETPRREAAGALLALGLVTTGGLPVTLAVRRRMAGRHRRKR
ncbi:serine/threonine protein kinase [[Actinomadura] parvosata subsp. kistnae]|uniref:non-specific serine/threonine protein kinase n=1 Tax=[Actinomadura] parvosata subsp. kistnae TaxID=1909395 RepID=A0A1V0AGJ0_9ACTN|nr:serine/threonine-protein kinase [Nonomuraea sp. ATCC 55076]AQZ69351.1 serine/threonine protein kinase [Nonomuraea sp. ATCC 55076]